MGKKLEKVAPDDLDKLLGELDEVMVKELGGCGTQKEAMQKEVDKARETAKTRCEKMVEDKKKAEAERVEKEKKAKEAAELAEKLLSELEPLVVEAEAALDEVKEAVTALSKEGGLASEKEVSKAVEAVNKAAEQSKDKSKVCTD